MFSFNVHLNQNPEKAMATHSSTLLGKSHGWRSLVGCSPWGRRVGHDWVTLFSLFTFMHWRRKWQPTPVFLPGKSQGWGRLVGCTESRTWLKRLSSSSSKSKSIWNLNLGLLAEYYTFLSKIGYHPLPSTFLLEKFAFHVQAMTLCFSQKRNLISLVSILCNCNEYKMV